MAIANIIRGISGQPELTRAVGALGAVSYIATGIGLSVFEVVSRGHRFDLIAFCTAFPGGLGLSVGAIAGAVALKDRHVAAARIIAETGARPLRAPAPPPPGAPPPAIPIPPSPPLTVEPADLGMRI